MEEAWKVYIIYNKNYSYCGVTPDLHRRLKKHNQEISGGAKYTKSIGKGWKYICYISGFKNKIDALRFEWAVKHCKPKKLTGIKGRLFKLENILNKNRWTSKSPVAVDYKLNLIWCDMDFFPIDFEVPSYIYQDIE